MYRVVGQEQIRKLIILILAPELRGANEVSRPALSAPTGAGIRNQGAATRPGSHPPAFVSIFHKLSPDLTSRMGHRMHIGVDLARAYRLGQVSDTRDVHADGGCTVRVRGNGGDIRVRQREFGQASIDIKPPRHVAKQEGNHRSIDSYWRTVEMRHDDGLPILHVQPELRFSQVTIKTHRNVTFHF